jgi:hypothetical protein
VLCAKSAAKKVATARQPRKLSRRGTEGQVIRMTELERAIQWLEDHIKWYGHEQEIANHCRVLLDALRWVPCAEKMPTEDDADENGYVLTIDTSDVQETFEAAEIENWNKTHDRKITHWRPLPPKPEGSE